MSEYPMTFYDDLNPRDYNIMDAAQKFIYNQRLSNYKINIDQEKGIATINYNIDGLNYYTVIMPSSEKESKDYKIWALHKDGMTQAKIAELLGISQGTISNRLRELSKYMK